MAEAGVSAPTVGSSLRDRRSKCFFFLREVWKEVARQTLLSEEDSEAAAHFLTFVK